MKRAKFGELFSSNCHLGSGRIFFSFAKFRFFSISLALTKKREEPLMLMYALLGFCLFLFNTEF